MPDKNNDPRPVDYGVAIGLLSAIGGNLVLIFYYGVEGSAIIHVASLFFGAIMGGFMGHVIGHD